MELTTSNFHKMGLMRKFILITTLLFASCTPQLHEEGEKPHEATIFPFGKKSFEWTAVEQFVDEEEKIRFATARHWLAAMYPESYQNNLHALDLNGDNQLDFIYSGPGPVNDHTVISLGNRGDDFSFDGVIVDLKIKDSKNIRLFLSSIVQTAAPEVERQTILDISFEGEKPVVKTLFKNETIQGTRFPTAGSSYEIETTSDTLIARTAPVELDTPYHEVMDMEGNRLGLLAKGTRGTVVGEQTDSLKVLWICVLIDPQYRIHRYPYPYAGRQFNPTDSTTRMVWITEKGVRKR